MEAEQWCLVRQEELDMIRRKDILGNFLLFLWYLLLFEYWFEMRTMHYGCHLITMSVLYTFTVTITIFLVIFSFLSILLNSEFLALNIISVDELIF